MQGSPWGEGGGDVVLELKRARRRQKPQRALDEALAQIEDRQYAAELLAEGCPDVIGRAGQGGVGTAGAEAPSQRARAAVSLPAAKSRLRHAFSNGLRYNFSMLRAPIFIALLLALPGAARAEQAPVEPTAAALAASDALQTYCSDVASAEGTAVASATRDVATALADVSQAWDSSHENYLLYWRGLLYHCIENTERAKEDLSAFVAAAEGDPVQIPQLRQAKRRLARIERAEEGPVLALPAPGAWGVGGGLLGVSGGLLGLALWQGQQMRADEALYRDQAILPEERQPHLDDALVHEQRANIFFAVAAGSAAGAAVTLLLSSAVEKQRRAVSVSVAPSPQGVALGMAVRW